MKLKKSLTTISLAVVLTVSGLSAGITFNDSQGYYDGDEPSSFDAWVAQKSVSHQIVGVGYSEESLALEYGVNTPLYWFDIGKSNLYTYFELNNNRLEFYEAYDVIQNNGYDGKFMIMPYIGISVDTSSAEIGSFVGVKTQYNFYKDYSFNVGYKYFLNKPYGNNASDSEDKKGYGFVFINFKF